MPWIYVWTSPIKSIYVWTTPVKEVYVWTTKVRPTVKTTDDYTTTITSLSSLANTTYFYWVKFTALKTWKITKVGFLATRGHQWILKIAQWNYANVAWTEYSLTTSNTTNWIYTLSTPFQINNWYSYFISFRCTGSTAYCAANAYQSWVTPLPVTRTAVRYDYTNNSSDTTQRTNQVATVRYLTIEYS